MKKILVLVMLIIGASYSYAQSVERSGNNFTQVVNKKDKSETKTDYTFTDSKGITYDIYLSNTGKAFIKKTSKNGKEYRQYVPEIGKQINPDAYKENKEK